MRKVRRDLKEMHEFIHWLAFRKVTGDVMGIVYNFFFPLRTLRMLGDLCVKSKDIRIECYQIKTPAK